MDHYEAFRSADSDEKRAALIAGMTEDERAAVLALAETEAATLGASAEIFQRRAASAAAALVQVRRTRGRFAALTAFLAQHGVAPGAARMGEMVDFLHPEMMPGAFDDPERLPSAVIAEHKAREGRP